MIPNAMKLTSMAVPPRLMNGRGIPVMGRRPTDIPMFSMKWNANEAVRPTTIYEYVLRVDLDATYKHLERKKNANIRTAVVPMKPTCLLKI